MSFNSLKSVHGTKLIQAVAIYPNACKYTTPDNINKGLCSSDQAESENFLGNLSVTLDAGSDLTFFDNGADFYAKILGTGEIVKCTLFNATTLNINAREQFGTARQPIALNAEIRVMHSGEADGSCYGYPARPDGGGCSTFDSFDRDVEREFLFTNAQLVAGEIYYNGLTSISHSPTELKPGEEMAKNATATITIQDNTDDDTYSVPYERQRTSLSTLFRKLLARHPYMRNRRIVTYTGFSENNTLDRSNFVEREYIIDDLSISKDDRVSIKAIDPLMLSEESKAKAPQTSAGRLLADINNASTEITLKDYAVGEYGNNGDSVTVIIDNELINCTVTDSAGGVLTIVDRNVAGSELKEHKINATVQIVLTYTDFNPISLIVDLLQTYTNIESRFFDDYSAIEALVPNNFGTIYIPKPTAIKTLINEIIKTWSENNISLYFDELAKKIAIKASGDFEQQPITITDEKIKIDSLRIVNNYTEQLTRASIGFAPFDAAKKVDDENSSIIYQSINFQTEQTGTLEPQEAKEFYSRFLTNSDVDVGIAVGGVGRIANTNVRAPKVYTFDLDYENFGDVAGGKIEEGELINLTTATHIGDDGQPRSENLQILSIKDNPSEATVTVKARLYQDIINEDDFDFIIDEDKENYILSDDFAPAAGEYTIFITSGVTIGATSTSNFAFDTGTQAAGVSFKIIVRGSILGAGGSGPSAGDAVAPNPNDLPQNVVIDGVKGGDGGDSMNLTVPCEIDTTQGVIYAGGAGAPSTDSVADSSSVPIFLKGGDGGNGGQGYVGGTGGINGTASVEGEPGIDSGVPGENGSRARPGNLSAISAGAWGEDSGTSFDSGAKGLGGYAIRSNGNSVTLIGDNSATIKGKRDF